MAHRSHSSGESGDARAKEVFDLHIQEMLERGEVSGSVAKAFHIFADQIRLLNGQVSSMRKDRSDENQQAKDRVSRLATEVATQSDADRMRMIVQRFAGEIVPDSRAIVRHAIDEQAEIVDQRINLLSSKIRESVRDTEVGIGQLRQVIQENHQAIRRSHAASEDQTLDDLEKLEKRVFSVEKIVKLQTPSDDPTASGPDRATSSGTDASFRELNMKLDRLHVEHDKLAKWVTESIGGLHEEQVGLAEQVSRLRSGRGYQVVDRPAEPDSPQDWHEAIEEIHRKVQDLSRGFHRQRRDHDIVVEKVEAANSRIAAYEASSRNLQQVIEDIRRQVRSLPSGNEQTQSFIRRELASYRNSLDSTMRRMTTVESNVHTLNGMNNRVMAQLAEIEGHVDDAADIIQGVQQNPRGLRERQNVGYNAFAGQGHRIRSPTPTPGDGHGRDTDLSVRPGGPALCQTHLLGPMLLMQTDIPFIPLGGGRTAEAEGP